MQDVIVHNEKQPVVVEVRIKDVFNVAKQLEDLGLEIESVLYKSRTIFGNACEHVLNQIKVHPLVSSIEVDK